MIKKAKKKKTVKAEPMNIRAIIHGKPTIIKSRKALERYLSL